MVHGRRIVPTDLRLLHLSRLPGARLRLLDLSESSACQVDPTIIHRSRLARNFGHLLPWNSVLFYLDLVTKPIIVLYDALSFLSAALAGFA